ncbi:MAG: pyridoxal phosphate-dependent aminotransferase [Candidatus Omnitrophica bacterium]|nr:pyridoxal phosphate-dependent aminotransferase [Candidatus Omnitrophota bacterium]
MKTKFAKRVAELKPSATLAITSKAKEMKKRGLDVVGFGAGEPDFDTPPNIKEAAIGAIKRGFTKYTPAAGTPELREAVCEKLKKDNALSYIPEQVVISCGAKHALYNVFQVLCEEGDEVIVISPYWVSYPEMIYLSGAKPRFVEAKESDGFVIDPKALEKSITGRTKAIVINSPSNPTGAVFGKGVLGEIAKIAASRNIFVISDEIYEKLIYGGEEHVSIGSLAKDIKDLTITINGVSKTYSMTGWRIGYAAGPLEIMKKISALQSHSTSNPTSISQAASVEAMKGDQAALAKMKEEFERRRDYMVERINSLDKISCVNPKGAFYVFCNISKTNADSTSFCGELLEKAHVACVPGAAFGSDKHIRLSFATDMETIKKGLDRIEKYLYGKDNS